MKIYSWNVNGIRAVQKKGFIEWIEKEQPDILCLQEIKANKDQLDNELLNINGYKVFFNSAEKKGYSGVAVYTKKEPLWVETEIGISKFENEGRIQILDYEKFILFNIYFPNGQMNEERLKYKLEFYAAILKYCDTLKAEGKKLIICGDYNTAHNEIDLKNPKANQGRSGFLPIEREWLNKLVEHGYVDTFRFFYPKEVKYSWWSYRFNARKNNTGWRIDYFFVSDNFIEQIKDAQIYNEVLGSDHCPISITL